ncbi:hypothetical protein ES695_16275 [Candidatus Atribacteria bacterium 1244-E10-H5-B2]|nr:MAG: hypothetical protein ES695_16275 [Candidatus Atribacteria bacterium 1244-E10-H5-B2]
MTKVSYLKKIINEKFNQTGLDNIALLLRFLSRTEEKELSRWYVITREPFGFVKFEKREGVFDEDNGQLKLL